jgi:DNA polymerase-3 subunit epsilon
LDTRNDQLLSIGAVAIQNWEVIVEDRFECLVHQEYEPLSQTITIHGILPKYRDYSLSEKEAVCSFLTYIRQSVLIGHHLNFDVSMINVSLTGITGKKVALANAQIDTINLARRLLPTYHPLASGLLSLDQLAIKFNIPAYDRHTAPGDAFMTAILFLKILGQLKKRGNKTLGDLLRK